MPTSRYQQLTTCKPELQAIVLAGGVGSRVRELTKKKPKCLLPIGNRPMIYYPLKSLVDANFTDVIVIVPDVHQQEIAEELRNLLDIRIEYVSIPMDQQLGTAESLSYAKDRIISDLIVLSCDIVTDFPLIRLITLFRDQDPSLIALVSTRNPTATTRCFGSAKSRPEKDLIGVDGNRLVFFNLESDFGQSIPFSRTMFRQCPDFQIFSNYFDSHIYFFKKYEIDNLIRESVMTSLKGEFLPHLVQKQFCLGNFVTKSESQELQPEECREENDVISKAFNRLDVGGGSRKGLLLLPVSQNKYPDGKSSRCFVEVMREGYCVRSNSLAGYIEANKMISSTEADKTRGRNVVNSILGKNSTCADNSHLIRSVVGSNCNIKANVKISDSVIMDGVTIEEGSVIQASILCPDSRVGKKSSLERCLVSSGYQIHPQSQFSNEFLADGGEVDMFEF